MLIPVILCGGAGSRLWPVSRQHFPKQFLPLNGQESLLQDTVRRAQALGEQIADPIVVSNDDHRFMVAEQLRELGCTPQAIVLEPAGKNTAPAIAVAAAQALSTDQQAVLLVMPADHIISDTAAFRTAVEHGLPQARAGKLVTFGIVPTAPETGYGYIQAGGALSDGVHELARFVEKPDQTTAQAYLDSGDYYWNSGMFLLSAAQFLNELQTYAPEIHRQSAEAFQGATHDLDFTRLNAEAFAACPSDSIDYAVMERTGNGAVVPVDCGWSDVGSWSSLWGVKDKDDKGNVTVGDTLTENVSNSYLRSDSRLVAAVGVDNLVVVETADAVLVADKQQVQDVKALVTQLKAQQRDEATVHKRVYRPWGSYESLVSSERFQVKRIIVNPGQRLSLQMHHHRAEHWIVVSGTAEVTRGEQVEILTEDQSTYIPLGTRHRLSNPGVIALEIIEVQTGSYLGEDDIVRYEDVYGRGNGDK